MEKTEIKIKLIMPPRSFTDEAMGMISIPPLGIAYLAAFLKAYNYNIDLDDIDIKVISNNNLYKNFLLIQREYTQDNILSYLQNKSGNIYLDKMTELLLNQTAYLGYNIFGFSLIESSAVNFALLMARRIKKETGCLIVFGGSVARPELKAKHEFIDYVVCGPGEQKLFNIIRKFENRPIFKYFTYGWLPKMLPSFTGLPLACYRKIPTNNGFSNPGKILVLPYIWSWGCPYRCTFCGNSLTKEFEPVLKNPSETVNELSQLSKRYNTKYFFVLNEYIHIKKKNIKEICRKIIDKKMDIVWCGSARCNIDNDLLPILYKAGCRYLYFGLESASDNILRKMKKGYTGKMAEITIRQAHKSGTWINVTIIVGFPGESETDFLKTFEFINRNHEYLDQIAVSPFYLIQSAILLEPKKYGIEIITSLIQDKNSASGRYSYNEIKGPNWEEIEKIKETRLKRLLKLFYLYKQIPESNLRSSTYEVLYACGKFKRKSKVRDYIKELYLTKKSQAEFILNINSVCNNKCRYCRQPAKIFRTVEDIKSKTKLLKKKKGIKTIKISGGEPTLHPRLSEYIELICNEGLEVKLNTNARILSYISFCQKLYEAGLRKISVPIYSYNPDDHDAITRVPGSFKNALAGIGNWKKIGGEVEIRAPLYKEIKNDMSKFVDFILGLETGRNF